MTKKYDTVEKLSNWEFEDITGSRVDYFNNQVLPNAEPVAIQEYIDELSLNPVTKNSYEYNNSKQYLDNLPLDENQYAQKRIQETMEQMYLNNETKEDFNDYVTNLTGSEKSYAEQLYNEQYKDSLETTVTNSDDWGDGFTVAHPANKDFREAGFELKDVEDVINLDNGNVQVLIKGKYYDVIAESDREELLLRKRESNISENQDIPIDKLIPVSELASDFQYREEDKNALVAHIKNVYENEVESVRKKINLCGEYLFSNLLPETQNQLGDISGYIQNMRNSLDSYNWKIQDVSANVEWLAKEASLNDEDTVDSSGTQQLGHTHRSSGGSSGGSSSGSAEAEVVPETPVEVPGVVENETLVAAAIGAVTFSEIVPMYQTLGSESTENSSTTTTYGLIGVEKYNEKYYYKIIDKTTGKIYYIEKNGNVKVESDGTEVLEVKSTAVRYDTTQLDNENNNATLVNEGSMYLVTGKETVEDDVSYQFAKILDSTDGKNYYIQVGENVEINSLENLGNGE